jgi:NADH-quinone oxidoreductase subunit L
MIDLVWMVPCLPLLGTIVNIIFSKNSKLTAMVGSAAVGVAFLMSIGVLFDLLALAPAERSIDVTAYTWITSGNLSLDIAFLIDPLSIVMMLIITGVGFLIHVYSIGYMGADPCCGRYYTYLNLFVFAMLLLVMGNNFLLMFVGWEGVGLCSYLLIGFWCERDNAAKAGIKAFVVNRVGDFAFIIGMLLIFVTTGSLTFKEVFATPESVLGPVVTAITILLFVGAMGKSAQVPLHVWLPDAMEGPTPVSALIHAATMVTAGVYMVVRCNALFVMSPVSMAIVAVVGALTAIFAASIGLVQRDIKRVLAYSTISQLGFMFLACGVGAFAAGIFHLMTHAFFKALLFMGAGSVIHTLEHSFSGDKDAQDLRNMGGLKSAMPRTYITMMVAALAISGIFPLSGFFSKDAILWAAFDNSPALWVIGLAAAFMTAFYMFRLMFLTFHGKSRLSEAEADSVHETPSVMSVPLILLAGLSVVGGFVWIPIIEGGNRFGEFLSPVIGGAENSHPPVSLELGLMMLSMGVAVAGIGIAYGIYVARSTVPGHAAPQGLHKILLNKYYVDEIYDTVIVRPIKTISWVFWKVIDVGLIDGLITISALLVRGIGSIARYMQTGVVQNYALAMVIGAVLIIGYFAGFLR